MRQSLRILALRLDDLADDSKATGVRPRHIGSGLPGDENATVARLREAIHACGLAVGASGRRAWGAQTLTQNGCPVPVEEPKGAAGDTVASRGVLPVDATRVATAGHSLNPVGL